MSETTEAPATEATDTPIPGAVEGAQTTEVPASPAAPEPDRTAPEAAPKEDWREQRIRALTAKNAAESERVRSLEERLEALIRAQPKPEGAAPAAPAQPSNMEAMVAAEVDRRRFDEACNTTYSAGKAKFPDFDAAVGGFNLIGGAPPAFLKAVTALDHSADVFYTLGKDPSEAMRVMALPPERMAIELARMEAKITAPPPPKAISRAPSPISPIAAGHEIDENAEPDIDADPVRWMKWAGKKVARK